jgi:hypothetical protein
MLNVFNFQEIIDSHWGEERKSRMMRRKGGGGVVQDGVYDILKTEDRRQRLGGTSLRQFRKC